MRRFFPFRLSQSIGLDIQGHEICLLQLQTRLIKKMAVVPLPTGAVREGRIQEADVVSRCLRDLVCRTKTKGQTVAIALPDHCVFSKRIESISNLPAKEREQEIKVNINRYFSNPTEALCIDYALLETREGIDTLLVAAVSHEYVSSYVDTVESAGLRVKIVDIESYARQRGIDFLTTQSEKLSPQWWVSCGLAQRGMRYD